MVNINVIYIDTNKYSFDVFLNSMYLKDIDIDSLKHYKNEINKKEQAASLLLKRKHIPDYYIDKNGKPMSKKTYFNISHSHGLVVLVLDQHNIGVDIEKIKEVEQKTIDFISSNEEKKYIKNIKNFYEVWTNKESLVKAKGLGMRKDIKLIPSLPINGKKAYDDELYYSKTIVFNDYILCVTRTIDEPFNINLVEEI